MVIVFHPRVFDGNLPLSADILGDSFFGRRLHFLFLVFPRDFGVVGNVLELELHEEVELAELLRHQNAQMMLLEGKRLVRPVGKEPEVVVPVQVHLAVDGLAQRGDGVFLRLDVLLADPARVAAARAAASRAPRCASTAAQSGLVAAAISARRTAISFCCARRGCAPQTSRIATSKNKTRFIDAPSHNCIAVHEDTPPLLPVIGPRVQFQYIAATLGLGIRDWGLGIGD